MLVTPVLSTHTRVAPHQPDGNKLHNFEYSNKLVRGEGGFGEIYITIRVSVTDNTLKLSVGKTFYFRHSSIDMKN